MDRPRPPIFHPPTVFFVISSPDSIVDVLIVGAGMSGMAAASELVRAGRKVRVVDKGRGIGGRMATRRVGEAVFDHGAQFITARSSRFLAHLQQWSELGVVKEWCRGFSNGAQGNPRWRGNPSMPAVPRHLAQGVDVLLESAITSIARDGDCWIATLQQGGTITSRAVLLTAPVPQSLALLDAGRVELPAALRSRLDAIEYERCLAVLAVLGGPSQLLPPGGIAFEGGPLAWIGDNQLKGISPVPCVTLHASHAYSLEKWGSDRQEAALELLQAAAPWIGTDVTDFQVHGWLYSKPLQVDPSPCAVVHEMPPLILAGDAFVGPKVEGAALSGWAAADVLLGSIHHPS